MLNHASCFPEIAGDAAVYFHMNAQKSDFIEKFEWLYNLPASKKEELLQKQRERLKRFSWNESAKQLASIYENTLKQINRNT